ncbi:MAG: hypothetical protein IAE92_09235 [Burkholderiaceae bacterium]|nr:hypothetical protein [Burkholderiaceae bacterium]
MMRLTCHLQTSCMLLTLASTAAWAQGNSAALTPQLQAPDACKQEVSKFEQTIGFIRQTQGNKAAAELKEKLLPAKLENEILFKDGYCGLAKYIRDKKLN